MTTDGNESAPAIRRVLAVKPSSLGDILHLFPTLEAIRRRFPEAKLDFLVHPAFAPLLRFSPWPVERTILFERRKLGTVFGCLPESLRLIRALRRERYDAVIDFQGLMRSAFFSACARSPVHAGFAEPREAPAAWFYSHRARIPGAKTMHAVERSFRLAETLFPQLGETPPLPELPQDPAAAAELDGLPAKFIALLPGARWPSKCFPAELFARVAESVGRRLPEYRFVAVGSGADSEKAEAISRFGSVRLPLDNWCGKTSIPGMVELLRRAAAVVSNDSGPVHAAALLKRPVFAFYGSTLPELTGPFGPEVTIFRANEKCLGCRRRVCPRRLECHRIDPETVADAIVNRLTADAAVGAQRKD